MYTTHVYGYRLSQAILHSPHFCYCDKKLEFADFNFCKCKHILNLYILYFKHVPLHTQHYIVHFCFLPRRIPCRIETTRGHSKSLHAAQHCKKRKLTRVELHRRKQWIAIVIPDITLLCCYHIHRNYGTS